MTGTAISIFSEILFWRDATKCDKSEKEKKLLHGGNTGNLPTRKKPSGQKNIKNTRRLPDKDKKKSGKKLN